MASLPFGAMSETDPKWSSSDNMKQALALTESEKHREAFPFLKREVKENEKNYYAQFLISRHFAAMRNHDQALRCLDLAVKHADKKDDMLVTILKDRSQIHSALGNEEKAKADLGLAIKLFPKNVTAYVYRSEYFVERDDFELAEKDMEIAMKLNGTEDYVLMEYAIVLRNLGKYDKAIETLNFLINMKPHDDYPYLQRSVCYTLKEDIDQATDDIIEVMRLEGDTKNHLETLAAISFETVDTKLRVEELRDPENRTWPLTRGLLHRWFSRNLKEALISLKRAEEIKASPLTVYTIAECWSNLGDTESALEEVNHALAQDSTDVLLWDTKINYLKDLGRYEEAMKVSEHRIFHNPASNMGYKQRGILRSIKGDVTGAIDDLTMALAINPSHLMPLLRRGHLYRQIGDEQRATADFRKVTEIDTIPIEANNAIFAYCALGEKDKALTLMNAILEYNTPESHYDAACLYALMSEKDNALRHLRQALETGYRKFDHIMTDDDLESLRDLPEFKSLVDVHREKALEELNKLKEQIRNTFSQK